jgi:RimJ/RimL family protein N-acetyltransferase
MRFTLITKEDLPFLNETRNLVAEDYLHDSRKFSLEESIEWFKKTNPDYWMIKVAQESVGYFRLSNHSVQNKNIYIGADIHPEFQERGYAKEAYKNMITQLFEEYDLHKISLEVLATNYRAINLYEKLGFTREGVKREEVLKGNIYVDSIVMSILKYEWK